MQESVTFGHTPITETVCRARFRTLVTHAISRLLENDFEDFSDRVVPGPDLDVPPHDGYRRAAIVAIADICAVRHDVEMAFAGRVLQRTTEVVLCFRQRGFRIVITAIGWPRFDSFGDRHRPIGNRTDFA